MYNYKQKFEKINTHKSITHEEVYEALDNYVTSLLNNGQIINYELFLKKDKYFINIVAPRKDALCEIGRAHV